ncbi:MAG: hypothetical protein LBP53_02635, partial [Candidatus Peribacteria bacterium]|nr:hypothetical protein [Candidatus Peribacteria bacterium]
FFSLVAFPLVNAELLKYKNICIPHPKTYTFQRTAITLREILSHTPNSNAEHEQRIIFISAFR